jgi:hypothetical protein
MLKFASKSFKKFGKVQCENNSRAGEVVIFAQCITVVVEVVTVSVVVGGKSMKVESS